MALTCLQFVTKQTIHDKKAYLYIILLLCKSSEIKAIADPSTGYSTRIMIRMYVAALNVGL